MHKLLVIGLRVETAECLPDNVAEPLAQDLQRRIEKAVRQLVFDLGENGSGHKMEVAFT